MFQPHNIFAFEDNLILHVYVATGDFSVTEFTDFADRVSLHCVPRAVKVLYPKGSIGVTQLKNVTKQIKARFRCDASFYCFDQNGHGGADEATAGKFLEKARDEIIRQRDPILLPPPGKSFAKPSGAQAGFFIQASNLFIRHAEMSLFALLLVREWGDEFDESIKTVYVDTIDLYGLVSLACRIRFGNGKHGPITVSYSSYSGYKEVLKHADVSSSLMVISATTSHKLLRKILTRTRWKAVDRVVTILDLDESLCTSACEKEKAKVISHLRLREVQPHSELLPSIRLSGEKFSVEVDDPKSVVLNTQDHAICLKHLKLDILTEMVPALSGYAKMGSDRAPIHVHAEILLKCNKFKVWLKEQIEKYAPASTSHVVCMGEFKDQIAPLLEIFGSGTVTMLSPEQLRDPELKIVGSVIVICPSFTKGTKLLEVSRDLRKQKYLKNIVYFSGVGTPESLAEFKKLKQNLEHGTYQVRSFCNVCTGRPESLGLSWKLEQELLRDEEGLGAVEELRKRAENLENGVLNDNELFYDGPKLELHQGFKYWEGLVKEYPSPVPSILLFATFSFLLQNARTESNLPEKDKLAPLPNRRVLLDPENFFRYNDSLIQVAILRAAFPGELDFSDHDSHSSSMYYLIERAVKVGDGPVVYEFLLALATNRLRLVRNETEKIRELIRSSEMKECRWFKTTKFFRETVK